MKEDALIWFVEGLLLLANVIVLVAGIVQLRINRKEIKQQKKERQALIDSDEISRKLISEE